MKYFQICRLRIKIMAMKHVYQDRLSSVIGDNDVVHFSLLNVWPPKLPCSSTPIEQGEGRDRFAGFTDLHINRRVASCARRPATECSPKTESLILIPNGAVQASLTLLCPITNILLTCSNKIIPFNFHSKLVCKLTKDNQSSKMLLSYKVSILPYHYIL